MNSVPAIIGGGVAVVGSLLAYSCYSPTSQLYGKTLAHCRDPKHLALTFDDGPNDIHTERLLDVLARHEVKATFFLIGRFVENRPQIARMIAAAEHLIGNHSYSHPNMLFLSRHQMREEMLACSKAIGEATGITPQFFRPPWGARRPAVLRIARELNLQPVMWDVTCFDWREASADAVERHARKRIERDRQQGHIVLLHDGADRALGADRAHSVEATDRLLRRYKEKYSFRRIDQV